MEATFSVAEARKQLQVRGLRVDGARYQVYQRLARALEAEGGSPASACGGSDRHPWWHALVARPPRLASAVQNLIVGEPYMVVLRGQEERGAVLRYYTGNKSNRWHCRHNCRPQVCRACKGSQICDHGQVRPVCKLCKAEGCGGASICEHGRVRCNCKDCGGSQICLHGKMRHKGQCKHGC